MMKRNLLITIVLCLFCVTGLSCSCKKQCPISDSAKYNVLKTDAKAPEFTAMTYDGQTIKLSELTKKGPVVLVLFRNFL